MNRQTALCREWFHIRRSVCVPCPDNISQRDIRHERDGLSLQCIRRSHGTPSRSRFHNEARNSYQSYLITSYCDEFLVNPERGFLSYKFEDAVIGVINPSGEMIDKPIQPHLSSDCGIRSDCHFTYQGYAISIAEAAGAGFGILKKMPGFRSVQTGSNPYFPDSVGFDL